MKDLTKGNPAKVMLQFAVPVTLGNVFQLFYSLADTRIVGSILGEKALAAVGATTSISTLFIGFLSGLTGGFALLTAKSYGAGEKDGVRRYSAGCLLLGTLTSLFLTLVCVGCLPVFLKLLNVPDDLLADARSYILIILLGMIMTMLYNACANILRSVGDTAAPLLFLMGSSLLNIVLAILFVLNFRMGVSGAALATVISQSAAALLCLGYMIKRYPVFRFRLEDFHITKQEVRELYSSGLSMAFMMSLVFFGTLSLQSVINTFGTEIIVAHTAARKMTEFFMLPFSVMGITMATFCSQNMGAGKGERIYQGIRKALSITFIWSGAMILLSYTLSPFLIHLITGSDSPGVLHTASSYLRINSLFYMVAASISIFRNALQGCGDHKTPVVSSFIELVGKVGIALFLTPVFHYSGIIAAEPMVWIMMVIPLAIKIKRSGKEEGEKRYERTCNPGRNASLP
ncbi:MATE family efflux transporter [Lacrimispora sp.]|uniref:MATE family efflux transporter n=1 Tax=Lacrimispora sp. TaxID=2719234 RepID=UPI003990FC0F